VVALESTIITHGMPHPQNVATAREVEAVVRAGGAVPATIAILGGRIKVGLSPDELEWLGTARMSSSCPAPTCPTRSRPAGTAPPRWRPR
jgi:pseudouridine-5'-phosphate glycosidase